MHLTQQPIPPYEEEKRKRNRKNPLITNHQSSSSSSFPCIASCRFLNASARPPARLAFEVLFGVPRPLAPEESCELTLTALSRGATGGAGFRPAILGLFDGGAGGAGLDFAAAAFAAAVAPFVILFEPALGPTGGGGGGVGLGAGATCSSRYDSGVQPWTEVVKFMHNHQPEY